MGVTVIHWIKFNMKGAQGMKEKIHPAYYQTKVTCGCGNTFVTGSTRKELRVDVCAKCHPFYTGERRMIDTAGRVEKFTRKYGINKKQGEA